MGEREGAQGDDASTSLKACVPRSRPSDTPRACNTVEIIFPRKFVVFKFEMRAEQHPAPQVPIASQTYKTFAGDAVVRLGRGWGVGMGGGRIVATA